MKAKFKDSVTLTPLQPDDREQFILDNQRAFKYGATEEFGLRDDHFEEDGEIISRATIEASIDGENAESYRILLDGEKVGGAVISVKGECGELELLFVNPEVHSKGIGYSAWCLIEQLHPEVTVWETHTPYFEKRNIHFYVNRCGFHIVEYFNSRHPDVNDPDSGDPDSDGMFRFQKRIRNLKSVVF
jgi:GNAT superfamily N-acetyltransferase